MAFNSGIDIDFAASAQDSNPWNKIENYASKITATSPRDQSLKQHFLEWRYLNFDNYLILWYIMGSNLW